MQYIFKAVVGSQAYGTAIETSDTDYKGVFVQPKDDILSFKYREQIEISKDECYYEVRRFIQLLQTANPTVLELLYSPEDCVVIKTSAFDVLVSVKDKFLTKKCLQSFGGYAVAQIKKAKGLDKKMNWDKRRIERKTPRDFCYAYENGKTIPIETFLSKHGLLEQHCGIIALDHFKDCYALYYDYHAHYGNPKDRNYSPIGYNGIFSSDETQMKLSHVPKGEEAVAVIYWNKDGYSMHCKDYTSYQTWLLERNKQRYVDIVGHNQQIDGKNLLHCRRLLDMAQEIATEGTIRVRRPNHKYLLSIRRGEVPLQEIIDKAEEDIGGLDSLFDKSGLPDEVDYDFCNDLLLNIRHQVNT